MTNDRTLIIKVIKGSKEDKWLQAQKNQSGSIRALIRTASRQIGDTDLREFLEDTGIVTFNLMAIPLPIKIKRKKR